MPLRVLVTEGVVSSPKRWPTLIGFLTSFRFCKLKDENDSGLFFHRGDLVIITDPIIPN